MMHSLVSVMVKFLFSNPMSLIFQPYRVEIVEPAPLGLLMPI